MRDWYVMQTPEIQSAFQFTLQALKTTKETSAWEEYEIGKELKEDGLGLFEMKFKVAKRKFRPAGFILSYPDDYVMGEAVLVLPCEKSGRTYIPHAPFQKALKLKNQFLVQNRGKLHEWKI